MRSSDWSSDVCSSDLQRALDDNVEVGLVRREAVDARTITDIVIDRLGEGVRLLEHHADARAQLHDVHRRRIDILAIEFDLAGDACTRYGVVHAFARPQEGRLAAASRAEEGGGTGRAAGREGGGQYV